MPCRFAISSHSLGRARVHSFAHKMDMARKYGIGGIELFFEDLESIACRMPDGATSSNLLLAAQHVRRICSSRGVEIICLQPFMHYEGLLDRTQHAERVEEMRLWIRIVKALGTDTICIPSTFLPREQVSGDVNLIVRDLREVAELGLRERPVVRFSYESLAWGTYADTWEKSWEVVESVDRPNFGLCLDTFNIAARVYADPTSPTGKNPDAEAAIKASMARLVKTVDVKKVFLVQLVDAERMPSPLVEGHEFFVERQPARMSWSRNCRLFYGEPELGGFLPLLEIVGAIFHGLKYEGWVSAELFNRCMAYEDPGVPEMLARRAVTSWLKVVADADVKEASARGAGGEFEGKPLDLHL